jgi:hypothetical protein
MRYAEVETVAFLAPDGRTVAVKEMRQHGVYSTWYAISLEGGSFLDEIASRESAYGQEGEGLAFKLFEHNAEDLTDAGFDLSRLSRLEVPL